MQHKISSLTLVKVGSEIVDLPMDLHGKSCMNSTLYDVVHHPHKAQAACG
jgi:hypothetical protein